MLDRRSTMVGGLTLLLPAFSRIARAETRRPMLVFVGNDLCPGCKIWRAQSEPEFMRSEAFGRLIYRVVHTSNAPAMLDEEYWPEDARWILTEFLMSDEAAQRGGVTPRFILAVDQQTTFTAVGDRGWKTEMWPKILDATKRS